MKFKKMISIPTLAALAVVLSLSGAWADAPNLLTYQGRILESGVLVNGSRNVTISICNALTGGSCDSTGTQSVSVNNGLFRTTFTAPTSGPNTLFGAGNRFLEVNVGGTVLTPREQLTSAPFAAVAGFVSPGNIGTGVLGSGVTISAGAIGTGVLGSSVVLNPGSIGTGVVVNSVSFSSNVGIGTTNPMDKLNVAGGNVRLTAVSGSAGSVSLFSILTINPGDSCNARCGSVGAGVCLSAWTSGGVSNACAGTANSQRCLCGGFGD